MKKSTLLLLLFLTFSFGFSQTILNAGEVAITGANADTTDGFSFVLLTGVSDLTVIKFTDAGWLETGGFRNYDDISGNIDGEGILQWTADSDLPCGTEIVITDTGGGTWSATSKGLAVGTVNEIDLEFDLAQGGDQILAFQGDTDNSTFLFGLHFANGNGWTDATDANSSAIPDGLTDGINALTRNRDNLVYKYNITANTSSILTAIVDPGEWSGNNNTPLTLGNPSGEDFICDDTDATILTAGDIAITGANADDPDQFSFVLLRDVVTGTEINFTDDGWLADGGFRNFNFSNADGNVISNGSEGVIKWRANSFLPCGTEIIITDNDSVIPETWIVDGGGVVIESHTGFNLAGQDQIIAFQGTIATPQFIFALKYGNTDGWSEEAISSTTSVLPTGLTNGINALARNRRNLVYTYNVTGNTSLILAAITNPAEWSSDNDARKTLGLPSGASFTCNASIINVGDIAITGTNANGSDQFSFVLLTDVSEGTEINFTDGGWLANGGFLNYTFTNFDPSASIDEGVLKWTADGFTACGTEIIVTDTGSNTWSATSEGLVEGSVVESTTNFTFTNSGGDQILVFQGTTTSPQFKYALHFGNINGWTDAIDENNSAVPAGLTNSIDAFAFIQDNIVYNYSVTTDQSLILAALVDSSNWIGNNGANQTLGISSGSFSCTILGDCDGVITWNGLDWVDELDQPITPPNSSNNVIIDGEYDSSTGNFSACSLVINSGAILTIEGGSFITVENDVTINGELVVEAEGNFVQNGVGALAGTFTGSATLEKTTPEKQEWYYYTYWSSPVVGETIGNMFPNVLYDWRYTFNASNFIDIDGDDIDDNDNDWEIADAADTMIPGVGYAVAGERSSSDSYPRADDILFTGEFNTGDITVPITFDPANPGLRWNFIGNPYPGAIDFVAFQLANSAVLDGAAYFWSQTLPPLASNPGNEAINLSQNDYAVFTIGTGGTAGGGADIPNGFVASAQGFFIPALEIGTATFTNDIRVADGSGNSQFFKNTNSKKSSVNNVNPLENRLWLNLTTNNGVFNQILVGYVDNATNDYDGISYDAPKILSPGFAAALYSTIENDDTRYVIQGKAINTISENEVIKLGFINAKVNEDTPFKFSIDQFEGPFLTNNVIYLKDNLLNMTHNLKDSDYTFTSNLGEFNSRFEIVFNAQSLSTDDNVLDNTSLKIIQLDNDHVNFTVSDHLTIKYIDIFDLLGRQLYKLDGNASSETYKLSKLQNAIYITKVQLSNGVIITKKTSTNGK